MSNLFFRKMKKSLMTSRDTKFAEQGRATQECDLSGSVMRKSRESRGTGELPSPAFCFFVQRRDIPRHKKTSRTRSIIGGTSWRAWGFLYYHREEEIVCARAACPWLSLLFAINAQNSGAVSAPSLLSVVSVLSAGMSIGVSVEF